MNGQVIMSESVPERKNNRVALGERYQDTVRFSEELVTRFIEFSNDTAAFHTSTQFSQSKGYSEKVVHGFLLSNFFSHILGTKLPGQNSVIGGIKLDFYEPVYVSDKIHFSVTVTRVIESLKTVVLKLEAKKQDGTLCISGQATCVYKETVK